MKRINNILTIDIEAWYCDLEITKWSRLPDYINSSADFLLNALKEKNRNATFFIVGYLAEKYPELMKKIVNFGHELGSHSFAHRDILSQNPHDFEKDVRKSIKIIEKSSNEKVLGYRAPFFTIIKKTSWAIAILRKIGLKYDSSIFPFKIYKYGVPDAPNYPYYISSKDISKNELNSNFLEFPISVIKIPYINKGFPFSGGFYLRLLPYSIVKACIKYLNRKNKPAIIYTHAWEYDLEHPRVNSIIWYNYYQLKSTKKKFLKLIKDFKFISIKDWIENEK